MCINMASVMWPIIRRNLWGIQMTYKIKAQDLKYGLAKQRRVLMITDEGWQNLQEMGESLGMSRSELIEQFSRGMLPSDSEGLDQKRMGELCAV